MIKAALILPEEPIQIRPVMGAVMTRIVGADGHLDVGARHGRNRTPLFGTEAAPSIEDVEKKGPHDIWIWIETSRTAPHAEVHADGSLHLRIGTEFPRESELLSALVPLRTSPQSGVERVRDHLLRFDGPDFLTCVYADRSWLGRTDLRDAITDIALWLADQELTGIVLGTPEDCVEQFAAALPEITAIDIKEVAQAFEVSGIVSLNEVPLALSQAFRAKRRFTYHKADGAAAAIRAVDRARDAEKLDASALGTQSFSSDAELAQAVAAKLAAGDSVVWHRDVDRALSNRASCSKVLLAPKSVERVLKQDAAQKLRRLVAFEPYVADTRLNEVFTSLAESTSPFTLPLEGAAVTDRYNTVMPQLASLKPHSRIHLVNGIANAWLNEVATSAAERHGIPFIFVGSADVLETSFPMSRQAAMQAFSWSSWDHFVVDRLLCSQE